MTRVSAQRGVRGVPPREKAGYTPDTVKGFAVGHASGGVRGVAPPGGNSIG
jgi:hypothetical protein